MRRAPHAAPARLPPALSPAQGLPPEADDPGLGALFGAVPGVVTLRVLRDRGSGTCTGEALLEMADATTAATLLDSGWRDATYYQASHLKLQFAWPYGRGPAADAAAGLDWSCQQCSGVNYGRQSRRICLRTVPDLGDAVLAA